MPKTVGTPQNIAIRRAMRLLTIFGTAISSLVNGGVLSDFLTDDFFSEFLAVGGVLAGSGWFWLLLAGLERFLLGSNGKRSRGGSVGISTTP
jgi:hypothetical protein